MKVYHGSDTCVNKPSLNRGRIDTDFGLGFYVSTDFEMAEKWACRKNNPVITEFDLDLSGLSAHEFSLDKEWLNFVIANRNMDKSIFNANQYDLLIGATADDKLFAIIEQYESGFITEKTAIEVLNCMKIGTQICIRTERALQNLKFLTEIHPNHSRIIEVREKNSADRKMAAVLTAEIIRKNNRQQEKDSLENQKSDEMERE